MDESRDVFEDRLRDDDDDDDDGDRNSNPDRPSLGLIAILTTLSLSILFYARHLNIFFRGPLFYSIKLECLVAAQADIGSVESSSSSQHQHSHHCYHDHPQFIRLLPSGSWICSEVVLFDPAELFASE